MESNYLADKSWMYKYKTKNDRVNPYFLSGVEYFMQFALADMNVNESLKMKRPCTKCENKSYHDKQTVHLHILREGFTQGASIPTTISQNRSALGSLPEDSNEICTGMHPLNRSKSTFNFMQNTYESIPTTISQNRSALGPLPEIPIQTRSKRAVSVVDSDRAANVGHDSCIFPGSGGKNGRFLNGTSLAYLSNSTADYI